LTDAENGGSIDRNKAIGYLIAKAMAAQVFGNKERCMAFTEAANIIKAMPSSRNNRDLGDKAKMLR
jgi:hypothetical protein